MAKKLPPEITDIFETQLPRWALLASAVRSAGRVQGLFSKKWAKAPEKHTAAVARANELSEKLATDAATIMTSARSDAANTIDTAKTARRCSEQCQTAATAAKAAQSPTAAFAAYAAKFAADVAYLTLSVVALDAMANNAAGAGDRESAERLATQAFAATIAAKQSATTAFAAADDTDPAMYEEMVKDLQHLAHTCKTQKWTDDDPIPLDFFARPIKFVCPNCGKSLRVKPEGAGKTVRCPNAACRTQITVPVPSPTTPNASQNSQALNRPPARELSKSFCFVMLDTLGSESACKDLWHPLAKELGKLAVYRTFTTIKDRQQLFKTFELERASEIAEAVAGYYPVVVLNFGLRGRAQDIYPLAKRLEKEHNLQRMWL